jgi:MYXO-CTERM domain-containing protein
MSTGRGYVYQGSERGLESRASTTLTGESSGDHFGGAVSGAGDVNGDGYADLVILAPGYFEDVGRAYVHHGYPGEDSDSDGILAADDCDDTDATVGGATTLYVDADGDGHGGPTPVTGCPGDPGYAAAPDDCDDTSAAISPAAAERCDDADTDEDCDGLADDADPSVDPSGFRLYFADGDGDGFGDGGALVSACDQPAGHVSDNTDCDDGDAGVHPAAEDVPGDGVDQDCDGVDAAEDPSDDAPAEEDPSAEAPSAEAPSAESPSDEAPAKSGCSTAPASPLPWLAALLAVPALARRRRG